MISFVMGGKVMLAKNSDHWLRLISSEKIKGLLICWPCLPRQGYCV